MEKVIINNLKTPSNAMVESLRTLKTNILFSGDDIKAIMVTSSMPNEGKSTVTLDLARTFTEAGKKVLFVDTDMRKTVLEARLRAHTANKSEIFGLSHYLSGQVAMEEVIYQTSVENLDIIFAGPAVVNPTELLEKEYFTHLIESGKAVYDYILIDTPPLGAVIDAAVIAKKCDGAVLVTAYNQVNVKIIKSVIKQLNSSGVRLLGAVLNKMPKSASRYGNYGGYYRDY